MDELWSATLDPNSPRYHHWKEILGSEKVPLTSPQSFKANLGDQEDEVYRLDVNNMSNEVIDRLVAFIRERFGAGEDDVRVELGVNGFPIRYSDVIVAFSLRAFL